jgi:mono/diheme cytochrome c family protein
MNKTKFIWLLTFLLLLTLAASAGDGNSAVDNGKQLFQEQCAACHNVNIRTVGPALANVDQTHSLEWIYNFVKSSQSMVKKGDKQAADIFGQFQIVMPDHPDITKDQVKDILSYIKSETKAVASAGSETPFDKPVMLQTSHYLPLSISNDGGFFAGYLVTVILLIIVLIFAVKVKDIERGAK